MSIPYIGDNIEGCDIRCVLTKEKKRIPRSWSIY